MKKLVPFLLITLATVVVYYKFFFLGKIPFPADLLVGSYSPWLDYYKIPVQNALISDVFSQFFLWKYLAIDSFKNLQVPLWNPFSFAGTPLLATYHSAVFYPLNILLFLPKYFGWGLYIFSQTLIASFTFYLFISQFTKSNFSKALGVIIFSLGGLMTTWLELGTAVAAMAWLPLSLYAVKKYYTNFKFRYFLILATSLFFTLLAGNAQVTTYSYLLTTIYLFYVHQKSHSKFINIFLPIGAILISVLLASFQLLPSLNLLQNSIRQTESYIAEANYGLLNIKDLFKFFMADYFGNPATGNYWGNLNYSETSGFLGILTLPILIYGLLKLRKGDVWFFFALLGFSLILVFDNPLSSFIYQMKLPLLTSSYASRMLFITLLSVATICALSVDHIIENKKLRSLLIITLYCWAAVLGIVLGTVLTYFYISDIFSWAPEEKFFKYYQSDHNFDLKNFTVGVRNTLLPLIILSISLLVLTALNNIKKEYIKKRAYFILFSTVLFLSFFDLSRYFLKYNPFVASNLIFPKVPALEFLQKQPVFFRVGREHAEVLPPNTWTAYNLYSYEGYDPIYLDNYGRFMHFLNGGDIRSGNSSRYAELASNYDSAYLHALNMKYFIAILRDDTGHIPGDLLNFKVKEAGFNTVFKDKSAAVLENPKALNRAYFAPVVLNNLGVRVGDYMMDKEKFDPTKTIALTDDLNISTVTGQGEVAISSYTPNKVILKTKTLSDEVLVLADQYEQGWVASIDGKETKISRANFIFRAIKVPFGEHTVIFEYLPKSFEDGLKISSITFMVLALFTFWSVLKKKNL